MVKSKACAVHQIAHPIPTSERWFGSIGRAWAWAYWEALRSPTTCVCRQDMGCCTPAGDNPDASDLRSVLLDTTWRTSVVGQCTWQAIYADDFRLQVRPLVVPEGYLEFGAMLGVANNQAMCLGLGLALGTASENFAPHCTLSLTLQVGPNIWFTGTLSFTCELNARAHKCGSPFSDGEHDEWGGKRINRMGYCCRQLPNIQFSRTLQKLQSRSTCSCVVPMA